MICFGFKLAHEAEYSRIAVFCVGFELRVRCDDGHVFLWQHSKTEKEWIWNMEACEWERIL